MIRGLVDDPRLALDNIEIARRHITAFLLQRYHQAKLPAIKPEDQPQLFAVLGSVSDFKNRRKVLNRHDLLQWLTANEDSLRNEISGWLPTQLASTEKEALLGNLIAATMGAIDEAIDYVSSENTDEKSEQRGEVAESGIEIPEEVGEEQPGPDPSMEPTRSPALQGRSAAVCFSYRRGQFLCFR